MRSIFERLLPKPLKFSTHAHGHGVLQMGAPHFQHVREFIAFAVEGIHEVQHDLAVVFHAVNQRHAGNAAG